VTRRPILVIEDSDEDFEILTVSLQFAAVQNEVIRLSTSREVAAYLRDICSQPVSRYPLLVLLDLNLPGVDGHVVLRQLREHPILRPVPIVMLTTSAQSSDIETCYRLGASGYMVKPADLDRYERMVRQMSDYWLNCVRLPQFMG
jgi:CheY-like chemotaxis protein